MPELRSRSKRRTPPVPTAQPRRRMAPPVPPGWKVNGEVVLSEELVYCLPNAPLRGYSKLNLADGSSIFRCRDCVPDVTGTRGDLMAHRNSVHGGRIGKNRLKKPVVLEELLSPSQDVEAPPGTQDLPDFIDPLAIHTMTIAEVMALAPSIKALGDLMDELESQRDTAVAELAERRSTDKSNAQKLEHYERIRTELLDLKLKIRKDQHKIDAYDEMRLELSALREWKKKMVTRLRPLGFVQSEEDDSGT